MTHLHFRMFIWRFTLSAIEIAMPLLPNWSESKINRPTIDGFTAEYTANNWARSWERKIHAQEINLSH